VFRMHVYGEVVSVEPVAGGKRVKVHLTLENQGGAEPIAAPLLTILARANLGSPMSAVKSNSSASREKPFTSTTATKTTTMGIMTETMTAEMMTTERLPNV
jgi:hypothetical protein